MINYLYIDDESDETISAFVDKLSNDNLLIEPIQVDEVNSEDFFINNLENYDGILLDLRTDELSKTSNFTGSVWGQHIRDLVTNKIVDIDIPIVLFSTDIKLRETYFKDMTSNNIFDRFLTKDNIPDNAIDKLISLSHGYKQILETKNFNHLLNIDISNLDERIFSRFKKTDGTSNLDIPAHEYAQMILKDLVYAKGVLINEKYLASRLGVDKNNSDEWEQVKERFSEAKYIGVFSDGWDRWWMYSVDDIFEEISGTYLSYLDAKKKVEILKEKLNLENLNYPEPIISEDGTIKNYSYRYWTMCKALKRPMDASEGFKVYTRQEPKPWQEYEYVSLQALLEENSLVEKDIKVHSLDREKYYLARSKV